MIIDTLTTFTNTAGSAITSGTTPLVLTNQIDLGAANLDIGNGEPVYIVAVAKTDIVGTTGAGSFTLALHTDDNAAMSSSVALASSPSYVTNTTAQTGSKAGNLLWCQPLPAGAAYERYLGVKVVPVTYAVSAGTIAVFLTKDPNGWKAYTDQF